MNLFPPLVFWEAMSPLFIFLGVICFVQGLKKLIDYHHCKVDHLGFKKLRQEKLNKNDWRY